MWGWRPLCWSVGVLCSLILLPQSEARAEGTTGLWPDISLPTSEPRVDPSKDAALVVGIERYDALPRIVGAADNARDWEKYFLFGRKVPPERVRLLTDQSATVEAISARAKELAAKVPEGGTLFVIFIGHGAPAEGGQKGLLLGADVRPSDASFASRSLSFEQLNQLVATGTQSRTVMVLDACFSGVSNEGKTLLPSVQPIVATSLVATARTTVLSAGTAGEYAGALPGSQRPALSYLALGALRGWADADGDGAVTGSELHAYASLVLRGLPNNHEQHPQIISDAAEEPLETVAKEKAPDLVTIRSKLDTWRPPVEEGPPQPKLRVAVGCEDTEPRGADDGISVYLDRSPAAAVALGGGKRWSKELGRNIVDHIDFPIAPGPHHVLVRIPGCESAEADVVADDTGADLRGALRADTALLLRGPAGSPNWGRIGVGVWRTATFKNSDYGKLNRADEAAGTLDSTKYDLSVTGILLTPSLTFRWWSLGLELGYAGGSGERKTDQAPAEIVAQTKASPSVSWLRAGWRGGLRFPFNVVALNLGVGVGYDNVVVSKLAPGLQWKSADNAYTSGWLMVDVHAFCDWPAFVGVDVAGHLREAVDYDAATFSIQIGAAFQPNTACRKERATNYTLTSKQASAGTKPVGARGSL